MGHHTVSVALIALMVFLRVCCSPVAVAGARVLAQDVVAASFSTPLDQPSADAAAATTTAVPASAEVEVAHAAVLHLQTTPDPVSDPALPEPAAQEQAVTSDVLSSALLDLGSAGITAAEPQQLAGGAADDGVVSAAATTNVLDLTATGTTSGKTPELIAVNVGHRYPGSNWALWMQRLGVNSARVFTTTLWGTSLYDWVGGTNTAWGQSLSGTAVTNLATFQAAVAELRTRDGHDPAKARSWKYPVKWSTFDSKWVTTFITSPGDAQEGNHNATLATLKTIPGMQTPLVVLGLGLSSVLDGTLLDTANAKYWAKSWEVYKHIYAFSRYLWLRGITRIEPHNEPDLDSNFYIGSTSSSGFKADLWADTIALRSRAIKDLYADMNAENSGDDLVPDIQYGAYAKTTYGGGNLGQPGVQAMHKTFGTGTATNASWFNFQTYSYHSYGQGGTTILSNFKEVLAASEADRTAQGLHSRFALTEFMARTSGDYSQITANPDQAADATKFASQAINLATAGADLASIYAFKFSVTLSGGNGVAKNGIHWGDNVAAPFNIADTTLAAEAYRLVAEHLSGAKSTYVLTSTATWTGVTDTKAIAVRDGNAYYVYIVNKSGLSSAILAQIKLAGLGIGAGVPVFVDSVNAASYGEVSEQLTTDATGSVSLSLADDNFVRLTVPAVTGTLSNLTASHAVHVRAGTNSGTNYGTLPTMCVGSSSTTHTNTYASVMRFSVANPATLTSAVLALTVSSLSATLTDNMPMLLLGIKDNSWTGSSATWTSLTGAGTGALLKHPPSTKSFTFDSVAKNFINYNSPGIQIVGHVTLPAVSSSTAAGTVKMVDVTSYVKASDGNVAFLLVRPFRRNKEVATGDTMLADTLNAGTQACFHSGAAAVAANRPRLLLY